MGRGDKKTAKGKRFKGSFGKSRLKKTASKHTALAVKAVKVVEVVEAAEEKTPKKVAKKATKKATKTEEKAD